MSKDPRQASFLVEDGSAAYQLSAENARRDEDDDALVKRALSVLARRHRRGRALSSPSETKQFLQLRLTGKPDEVFGCIFLNCQNRVIAVEELFYGTIDGTSVYPRVVARRALILNAAALIAFHNHPSGVAEPSHADTAITNRLRDALALVDIRLLDHFVVGDEVVSFAERGML